jgi:hypothetical protein
MAITLIPKSVLGLDKYFLDKFKDYEMLSHPTKSYLSEFSQLRQVQVFPKTEALEAG